MEPTCLIVISQVMQSTVDNQGQDDVTTVVQVNHTDMDQSNGETTVQDNTGIVLDSSNLDIDQDTGDMSAIDPSMANTNMVELQGTLMDVDNQDAVSDSDGGDNNLDNGDNELGEDNDEVVETVGDDMPDDQLNEHDLGTQLGSKEGTYSTSIQINEVDDKGDPIGDQRMHQCLVSGQYFVLFHFNVNAGYEYSTCYFTLPSDFGFRAS